jgi:small subunit ribosomal protein S3
MSPLKKHFIERGIKQMQINEYLRRELYRSGFSGVEMQKTPLGVRITLKTSRPGLVIGKSGKRIREITDVLQEKFNLNLPQIEVEEIKEPELNAQLMAERLAYSLDRGRQYRRATYYILRKIMAAGAKGVEIKVAGKVTSQRARVQMFRAGVISKCGQPALEAVDKGVAQCVQKSGVLGIIVKIMPAKYKTGDGIKLNEELLELDNKKIAIQKGKTLGEIEIEELEAELTEEDMELLDQIDDSETKELTLTTDEEDEIESEEEIKEEEPEMEVEEQPEKEQEEVGE